MALSAARNTPLRAIRKELFIPLKANAVVYEGGMVAVDSTGYGVDAATATGYQLVLVATASADNTGGANGAIGVNCWVAEAKYLNSGTDAVVQASLGTTVYVQDDQTIAKTNGTSTRSAAGTCTELDSDGVWVSFGGGI